MLGIAKGRRKDKSRLLSLRCGGCSRGPYLKPRLERKGGVKREHSKSEQKNGVVRVWGKVQMLGAVGRWKNL